MLLGDFNMASFCNETKDILEIVGWVVTIFKIAIPLLIVILGMFDFGKAVVSSKDDEIKKSAKTLGFRAVAGLIIFFIPSIVLWIFRTIDDYKNESNGFKVCETCILHPNKCGSTVDE